MSATDQREKAIAENTQMIEELKKSKVFLKNYDSKALARFYQEEKELFQNGKNLIGPQDCTPIVMGKKPESRSRKRSEIKAESKGEKVMYVLIFGAGRSETGKKSDDIPIYSADRIPTLRNTQKFVEFLKNKGVTANIHFLESNTVLLEDRNALQELGEEVDGVEVFFGEGENVYEERKELLKNWKEKYISKIKDGNNSFCLINAGYWINIEVETTGLFYNMGLTWSKKYTFYPYFHHKTKIDLTNVVQMGTRRIFNVDKNEFVFEKPDRSTVLTVEKCKAAIQKWNPKDIVFYYLFYTQIFYALRYKKIDLNEMRWKMILVYEKEMEKYKKDKYVKDIQSITYNYIRAYAQIFPVPNEGKETTRLFNIASKIIRNATVWPEGEVPDLPYAESKPENKDEETGLLV